MRVSELSLMIEALVDGGLGLFRSYTSEGERRDTKWSGGFPVLVV